MKILTDPRILALFACAGLAARSAAQSQLYAWSGTVSEDRFGQSVAGVGDLNGDGYADLLVGTPGDSPGGSAFRGSARVYSGIDGTDLFPTVAFEGTFPGDFYGWDVAAAGDANGDGTPDFLVSNTTIIPTLGNRVSVYSGSDGSLITEVHGLQPDQFGWATDGVGDANSDGYDDFIVGEPGWNDHTGRARVYSGLNGVLIHERTGDFPGDDFGWSVSGGGDANGDGSPDFIVGATHENWSFGPGYAKVYNGADGQLIGFKWGDHAGDRMGSAVNLERDIDGDGHADYMVGIPGRDVGAASDAGMVMVYSGIDGSTIRFHTGNAAGDAFGLSVDVADVNADGYADVLVGAPKDDTIAFDAGRVAVYSGQFGNLLYEEFGDNTFDGFGTGLDGAGTVKDCMGASNDAFEEIIVGAPMLDLFAPPGYARVYTHCGLSLLIDGSLVFAGQPIVLELLEGGTSDLSQVFAVAVDGAPIFVPLAPAKPFKGQGKNEVQIPTQEKHAGLTLDLIGLGLVKGQFVWSSIVTVKIGDKKKK